MRRIPGRLNHFGPGADWRQGCSGGRNVLQQFNFEADIDTGGSVHHSRTGGTEIVSADVIAGGGGVADRRVRWGGGQGGCVQAEQCREYERLFLSSESAQKKAGWPCNQPA
jgi:hypothetical protein